MTNPSTDDITIPDELADSLRRAATGLRGGPPDVTEVYRRRRHRQLHRASAALSGIGVLVAASIVAPRLFTSPTGPDEPAAPAVTASPTPAQRLLLGSEGWVVTVPSGTEGADLPERGDSSRPNYGFPPGSTGVVQVGAWEVTAAGEVVPLQLPVEERRGFHILGDGRIVTLEWRDRAGAPRYDGLCRDDDAFDYLRLYETDGTMSLSRDVRVRCEMTSLVGGTETEVFLIRVPHAQARQQVAGVDSATSDERTLEATTGRRLVAHNLADGTERTVANLDALPVHPDSFDANVNAGRIAAVADSYGCRVQILDIDTGVVTTLDLIALVADCVYVDQIRLSPDGGRLAVAYRTGGPANQEPYDAVFAVVDLAGPALRLREVIQPVPPAAMGSGPWGGFVAQATGEDHLISRYYPAGIAWSDDATVRLAWVFIPDGLDRVVGIDEVLDVQTYTAP